MSKHDPNKERLELALEAGGLDLWENDLVTGEVACKVSKIFTELGYTHDEAAPFMDDMFKLVHPDDVPMVREAIDDHLASKTEKYRCEFRIRSKAGTWVWFANYGKIMDRDAERPGRRFIGVTFNIDERKRKEDELRFINRKLSEQNNLLESMNAVLQALATSDPLTGIANRRKLLEVGENEVQRATRFGHPLSLLIIDIDHFKLINDTWGHMAGDHVICAVAEACERSIRNHIDAVGRIGGEEFAIVLPETDFGSANDLAERLRLAIAELDIHLGDGELTRTTISIGVAALSPACNTFNALLLHADRALYQAKDTGRNCVCHHAP